MLNERKIATLDMSTEDPGKNQYLHNVTRAGCIIVALSDNLRTEGRAISYDNITKPSFNSPKFNIYMSRLMRKPTICICENKDADQLRGNHAADQRLCLRYSDSTVPLLLKSKISSF